MQTNLSLCNWIQPPYDYYTYIPPNYYLLSYYASHKEAQKEAQKALLTLV